MKLYGAATCTKCEDAKKLLESMGLQFEYVDVATIPGYAGVLPQLELDDGTMLIGFLRIKQYFRGSDCGLDSL